MKTSIETRDTDNGIEYKIGDQWRSLADFVQTQTLASVPLSGKPTALQLQKINQLIPQGFPLVGTEDVTVITIKITDNFLNRGMSKWDTQSLKKMVELLPGKPALKDHNHESIDAAWGRYFEAQYIESNEVDDSILSAAGNQEHNQKIFDSEGYCAVYGAAFVANDHPILNDIRFARVGGNSLGGFRFKDFGCPICGTSLRNPKCPHVPDTGYVPDGAEATPYYVRVGLYDLAESSLVNIPNYPGSSII